MAAPEAPSEASLQSLGALAQGADAKKARNSAVRMAMDALARREHSTYELRQKLSTKFDDDALVGDVVEGLLRDNLVCDQRFAQAVCRARYRKGYGPARVESELNQHHISSSLVSAALAEYQDLWLSQLRELKERKFGKAPASDYKTWAKQARFLQSRGFTTDQIRAVLERV